jgi:hypothetical protein
MLVLVLVLVLGSVVIVRTAGKETVAGGTWPKGTVHSPGGPAEEEGQPR